MSNIPKTNQEELVSIDYARDGCTNAPTKVGSVDNQIDSFKNIPIIIEVETFIREKQESESIPLKKGNNEITDTEDIPMETIARQDIIIDMKEASDIQSTLDQAMNQMDKPVDILSLTRKY